MILDSYSYKGVHFRIAYFRKDFNCLPIALALNAGKQLINQDELSAIDAKVKCLLVKEEMELITALILKACNDFSLKVFVLRALEKHTHQLKQSS